MNFLWILQADVDGDGALNYGEFVAISVHIKKMGNDEHLHKAFAFFDRNQSGYIEIEELRESLNDDVDTNNEDVINAIMHDVDTDKVSVIYVFIVYRCKLITKTSLQGFLSPEAVSLQYASC